MVSGGGRAGAGLAAEGGLAGEMMAAAAKPAAVVPAFPPDAVRERCGAFELRHCELLLTYRLLHLNKVLLVRLAIEARVHGHVMRHVRNWRDAPALTVPVIRVRRRLQLQRHLQRCDVVRLAVVFERIEEHLAGVGAAARVAPVAAAAAADAKRARLRERSRRLLLEESRLRLCILSHPIRDSYWISRYGQHLSKLGAPLIWIKLIIN